MSWGFIYVGCFMVLNQLPNTVISYGINEANEIKTQIDQINFIHLVTKTNSSHKRTGVHAQWILCWTYVAQTSFGHTGEYITNSLNFFSQVWLCAIAKLNMKSSELKYIMRRHFGFISEHCFFVSLIFVSNWDSQWLLFKTINLFHIHFYTNEVLFSYKKKLYKKILFNTKTSKCKSCYLECPEDQI